MAVPPLMASTPWFPATSINIPRTTMGGMVEASALRMPKLPPHSASVKPLYQWLSSPVVMCPRLSI